MKLAILLISLAIFASATVHFKETFDDPNWQSRWVPSTSKEAEGTQGKWEVAHGQFYGDAQADKGLRTTEDARFYQISAAFPEFSNEGKDLILQFAIKHEQKIDCGGGYVKILPAEGVDQKTFNGDSPYNIMFGPDICGSSTKKTHVIFNYKGKNHLIKKEVRCESDEFTHLYTLILHPDNTYEVRIDNKEVQKGSLKEDWDMLLPKEIKDPNAKKPSDWVDDKMIADPTDKKPEGWDDIPAQIADPDARKPDDWDDELDGEWERPQIPNPDFKGEWKPKMIDNPDYKGEWVHPMVPNPEYFDDDKLYLYKSNKYVGIEVWQVKSGTIFDNFLVTDSVAEAEAMAKLTEKTREDEKKMFDKQEEERKAKEEEDRKKAEAEEKAHDHADHDHAGDKAKDEL